MSYFKQKDFASYLKVAKKKNNYEGYITTIYQKILKPSNIQILFDDLELCLAKYPAKAIEGLEKIQDFINITYSLSKQSPIGLKAKLYIVLPVCLWYTECAVYRRNTPDLQITGGFR